MMRTLCPNFNNEDGLDTVLEVPLPDEMFSNMGCNATMRWKNMRAWMKKPQTAGDETNNNNKDHFMLLLKLVGSPLIPFQFQSGNALSLPINDGCIEASTAKYIVQQYLAAMGGLPALNSVDSMYAIGQLKMVVSDIQQANGDDIGLDMNKRGGNIELGGFVLWQKNPDLWFLELVVSGCKISAGCDGKVAWSQSSTHPSQASKGPPKPLRRFFQGLDPRSTASLFLNAVCIGEKSINNEECFILKLEISPEILSVQSTPNTEIVHHRIWGCFSQRTGLLIQFEDTKLVRMKNTSTSSAAAAAPPKDENVYWETTIESTLEDYRCIDGINIAHGGRTSAIIYRYGRSLNHRAKIDETWRIEEVDFNICGLSLECFLPPKDLIKSDELETDDEPVIII